MHSGKKLIVVLGPTGIGKTAYAVSIAQHYQTEIISADSRQFFNELKIGVARPSDAELAAVPHHFVGFLPVTEHYSAGRFADEALALLEQLFQKHDVVVCVGGSMLYIDGLIRGFDDLPADLAVKQKWQNVFEEEGLISLQQALELRDPAYYAQMDIQNPHRLIRALEICEITGKKYSDLRKASIAKRPFEVVKIGLTAQRNWLYKRINLRVDAMIKEGLEEEVKSVYPLRHENALNTVGYKEFFAVLDDEMTRDEAIDKVKQHTRNFAKRQLTWWRRDPEINWIDVTNEPPPVTFAVAMANQNWK